jgi:hypothetical protein
VSSTDTANFPLLVSRNAHGEKVQKALRLFVGNRRRYSVKELSNGTGVPDRMIESAMCDPESPDWRQLKPEYLASIAKFLGASFASVYLELSGLGAFELMDGQIPLPGVFAAQDAADTAEIAQRAADGVFDEEDCVALREVGQREIERGMKLVSIGGGRA